MISNFPTVYSDQIFFQSSRDEHELSHSMCEQCNKKFRNNSLLLVCNQLNVCFSEKFQEVCDVCHKKYTTTLLQRRRTYTIISINRTKFRDPNLKSKCKIIIPHNAISCILHWREIQTHLIIIINITPLGIKDTDQFDIFFLDSTQYSKASNFDFYPWSYVLQLVIFC